MDAHQTDMKCYNQHPLIWSNTAEGAYAFGGEFQCNICAIILPCSDGRFLCSDCQYDVCEACEIKNQQSKCSDIKKCKNGHELTYSKHSYSCGSYGCDICNQLFPCESGRLYCSICQYDLCPTCELK